MILTRNGGTEMRCKICEITHKNTRKYDLWIENQVCRVCGQLMDFFSLNGNNLGEYWRFRI
jgi:hypothetical protein